MLRRALMAAVVLLLVTSLPGLAGGTAAAPDPSQIYVQSITYGGTGCPGGSVANSFSNDRTSFTLIFDEFVASVGRGVPITESRKNCQLNINFHIPQGFSYAISSFEYRGYVSLGAGQQAEQQSTYYFQDTAAQGSSSTRFLGPVSRDYLVRDFRSKIAWVPCSRVAPLNINTQVRISGNFMNSAQITVDSVDGKTWQTFGLQWRRC